jgi:hypothetical protein
MPRDPMIELNRALNNLQHRRHLNATQPMDKVDLPHVNKVDWSDRIIDWVDTKGLFVLAGVVAVLILALFCVGVSRAGA